MKEVYSLACSSWNDGYQPCLDQNSAMYSFKAINHNNLDLNYDHKMCFL